MDSAGPTSREIPMGDCAAHITECGVTDKVKIINKPASTIRVKIKTTTTAVVVSAIPNHGFCGFLALI